MQGPSTKQRVLDAALELFSRGGYDAVSMRDIAAAVGIKESSIYFHFRGKQAIQAELLEEFQGLANEALAMLRDGMMAMELTQEGFVAAGRVYYMLFLGDERIRRHIAACMILQHSDAAIAALYHTILFERPLDMLADFLGARVPEGSPGVVDEMALVYCSLMTFGYFKQVAASQTPQEGFAWLEPRLRVFYEERLGS